MRAIGIGFGSGSHCGASVHQLQKSITVQTVGRGFVDLTPRVQEVVTESGVQVGLCVCLLQHTSASLLIQENADPSVREDFERYWDCIAPEDPSRYRHADEGPDDMPAHLRAALTRTSETIPVENGRLALGTWQALYLCEHRRAPHVRRLVVHVIGQGKQ